MASMLIESLTRLFKAGKLTKEQIAKRVEKGTITADDFKTIVGEDYE